MVKVIKSQKHNSVVFGIKPSTKDPLRAFGQYMVAEKQVNISTNANGQSITNVKSRTAFVSIEDKHADLITEGMEIKGQIVREERFAPFYENQPCKVYPLGHPKAGEPVLVNGKKVWFKDTYTTDLTAVDKLVSGTVAPVAETSSNEPKTVAEGIK